MNHKTTALAALAAACLPLTVVACGDDKPAAKPTTSKPAASGVKVEGAWARTSPSGVKMGAAYMKLTSANADKLLKVSVDPSVAKTAEIHEMVMAGGMGSMPSKPMGSMSTPTSAPMMQMKPVQSIDLPAGTAVELKPGGYHIMFMELAKPLEKGTTIKLTLTFEKAGEMTVDVPVQDSAS